MSNHWLELDRDALLHNLRGLRAIVGGSRVMPVVKTNAYGAGAVPIARALAADGVDAFAVATVPEAVELRAHAVPGTVTVLTYFAPDDVDTIIQHDISPVVFTSQAAAVLGARADALGRAARVWVKIDSGLGRIGVPFGEALEFVRTLAKQPALSIVGLLSTLTENPERNPVQVERMRRLREEASGVLGRHGAAPAADRDRHDTLPLSLASTQGILSLSESFLDVVRPGIALLGVAPSPERLDTALVRRADLRPVVAWKARVTYVKRVPRGEQVGYGVRAPLERDALIATLAVGWADGYPQPAQGVAAALIRGRRAPIVAISANSTMVDVSGVPAPAIDDEAVLVGRQGAEEISAAEMAKVTGSLYRLFASVPPAVPRVWAPATLTSSDIASRR